MTATSEPQAPQHTSLLMAQDFFAPISLWEQPVSPTLMAALAEAPRVAPQKGSVFTSGDQGLVSCILAQETVSPDLQKQLDTQKQHLLDLTGLGSAYVRKQADNTKNPNLVYDTRIWQDVFNHLPLMAASQFTRQTYDQTMRGAEVATSFIEMILGFAVGGGSALASFATFLGGLGKSIGAGMSKTGQTYSTAAIAIVLKTQVIGSETQLIPMLKGYFIDFSESQRKITSSCASYESFHMQFDYRTAESIFNYAALANPDTATKFNALINGSQIDDINSADNFFNGAFSGKKTS